MDKDNPGVPNTSKEPSNSDEWNVPGLMAKEPILLSQFLSLGTPISPEIIKQFQDKAAEMIMHPRKTKREHYWLTDYILNNPKLTPAEEFGVVSDEIAGRSDYQEAAQQSINTKETEKVPPIKLNELVKKPESFDGYKPPARKWIDDFEKAAEANGWIEFHKVRYFSTFLDKAANDWFVTVARRKLGSNPAWQDLKAAFIRHYLGDSDKVVLRRQVENTRQGGKEKVTNFIPRFIRLVELCDPNKPEEELVDLLRSKLRTEYQDRLILCDTYTIEELNDACLKIEASLEQRDPKRFGQNRHSDNQDGSSGNSGKAGTSNNANKGKKPANNQNNGKRNNRLDNNKPDFRNNNRNAKGDKSTKICFNCGRKGHLGAGCWATSKANGEPCTPRVRRENVNAVGETHQQPTDTNKDQVVSKIRAAGTNSLFGANTIQVNSVNQALQSLIRHPVKCNGLELSALIDTGAFVSVINYDVAVSNRWSYETSDKQLIHAAGDKLDCLGELDAEIEFGIGAKSLTTRYRFLVVRNLCAPILIGLELIRKFKLVINPLNKMPLSFPRGTFKKGLRMNETTVVPARHAMVVEAEVQTSVNLIATIPFHFDNSIIVANSVSEVVNSKAKVLLVNLDQVDIQIKKQQQIASFQALSEPATSPMVWGINNVLPLGNTSSYVQVGEELTNEQMNSLSKLINDHLEAFSTDGKIGHTQLTQHRIELEPGARPFREKARRHAQIHIAEAKRQIGEMLTEGIIEPSASPWCSEYVMVRKKTGDWRLCVDFRRLNLVTKKDSYPLPNVEECLEQLGGKQFFSQMDFASGYWQLPIERESQELTAFRVGGEVYQFKRLPFGLTNAPATFQRLINALFAGMKGLNLQIFLDDICLATNTWNEHLKLLKDVFKLIIKANLRLKGSKCKFGTSKITFLGHQISQQGLKPDPGKVSAIRDLPPPLDVSGVKRILGAFGYYRKFVPKYSDLAEPLIRLTRKKIAFEWGQKEQEAFDAIKEALTSSITLTHLNPTDPVVLKTDASLIGVAGILLQEQNNELKIVACVSRHLKPAEKNYAIMEIEALAVVWSLSKFRHFLLGRHFKIITDHHGLKVLNSRSTRNARVERWALALSEYDYEIIYQKGKLHEDVDCLSRAPIKAPEDEFLENIFTLLHVVPLNLQDWIFSYNDDEGGFLQKAEEGREGFELREGVIYKDKKLYVPSSKRAKIMEESHMSDLAAHDGIDGIIVAVDHFTKFVDGKAVKDQVAERFSRYFAAYCGRFGIPRTIVTDNGKQFDNKCLDAIREQFGTRHQIAPAGHHQGNAICERTIQSLSDKLATIINNSTSRLDWEMALPMVLYSLNSKIHSTTGYAPFELVQGRPAPLVQTCVQNRVTHYDLHATVIRDTLSRMRAQAVANSSDSHTRSKSRFDERHREITFQVGEEVWIQVKSRSAKLGPKFEGPFKIISVNNDIYELENINKPTDKRRRHVSQMKRHVQVAASFICMLGAIVTQATSVPSLQETSPIFWEEDLNHFVSEGEETLQYLLHYVSPCQQIVEYARLIESITPTAANIQQAPINNMIQGAVSAQQLIQQAPIQQKPPPQQQLIQQAPIQQGPPPQQQLIQQAPIQQGPPPQQQLIQQAPIQQGLPPQQQLIQQQTGQQSESEDGQWVSKEEAERLGIRRPKRTILQEQASDLYLDCQNIFNQTIIQALNYFNKETRAKRQLAFVAGYIISNIVSEVKQRWSGQAGSPEFQKEFQNAITSLNSKTNLLSVALRAMNTGQTKVQLDVISIQQNLDQLPKLEAFNSYLISEMESKKMVLQEFGIGLRQGKTNTVLLSEIFGVLKFGHLEAKDISVPGSKKLNPTTIQLSLVGHIRSTTSKLYRVKHISFYTNENNHPVRHEYVGKTLVLRHPANDCVMAVDETTSPQIEAKCDTKHGRDPVLKRWRNTTISNIAREVRHSQYVSAGQDFVIYCWGNDLFVAGSNSTNYITTKCPTYPFRLHNNYSFYTSDELVKHVSKSIQMEVKTPVVLDVADFHFEDYQPAHSVIHKQSEHINWLINETERLGAEIQATTVHGYAVTWKHATLAGFSTCGLLFICMGCLCCYYRCGLKVSLPDMSKYWVRSEEKIKREVEEQSQQFLNRCEEHINKEVARQMTHGLSTFNTILANNLQMLQDRPRHSIRRPSSIVIREML